MTTVENLRRVREITKFSLAACKSALELSNGDVDNAVGWLLGQAQGASERRASKEVSQGLVSSYVHQDRIGVLVELRCETDFASRSNSFRFLCEKISMQVAAMDPQFVDGESEASWSSASFDGSSEHKT